MEEYFSSPIANMISLALGAAGLISACLFYRWGRRIKEPAWDAKGRIVLSRSDEPGLPQLRILYGGVEVPSLSVDCFVFWNSGRGTINREDIVLSDHLRLEPIDNGVILEARVLASNNAASLFETRVTDAGRRVLLDFEYLDQNHGAVIQVVNTSQRVLRLQGSIKGVTRIRRRCLSSVEYLPLPTPSSFDEWLGPRWRRRLMQFVALAFIGGLGGLLLWAHLLTPRLPIGFATIINAASLVYWIFLARRFFRPLPPEGLGAFDSPWDSRRSGTGAQPADEPDARSGPPVASSARSMDDPAG